MKQFFFLLENIGPGLRYKINANFFTKSQVAQNFSYRDRFLLKSFRGKKGGWGPSTYRKFFISYMACSLTQGKALIKIEAHLVSYKNCKVYLQSTGEYMGAQKQYLSRNRR